MSFIRLGRYWVAALLLLSSFAVFASSEQKQVQEDPLVILNKMVSAVHDRTYGLVYINTTNMGVDSMAYRHEVIDGQSIAQLIYMEGVRREVSLNKGIISYYQEGMPAFSLKGDKIIEALPAIAYTDFNHTHAIYNFMQAGRARTANKDCIIIRVIDKMGSRYSQLIWIDEKNYLPLRVDYLDENGDLVEQFKVVAELTPSDVIQTLASLPHDSHPPLLSVDKSEDKGVPPLNWTWQLDWLPQGFSETSRFSQTLQNNEVVDSRIFSDGLFTFNINVSQSKQHIIPQNVIKGTQFIHTASVGNFRVVFIGDLPAKTASRIVSSIEINEK